MAPSRRVTFALDNGTSGRTSGPERPVAPSQGNYLRHTGGLKIEIPKSDARPAPQFIRQATPWPGHLASFGPVDDTDDTEAGPSNSRDNEGDYDITVRWKVDNGKAVRELRNDDPSELFEHLDPIARREAQRAFWIHELHHSGDKGYNDYLHWARRHPGERPKTKKDRCSCVAKRLERLKQRERQANPVINDNDKVKNDKDTVNRAENLQRQSSEVITSSHASRSRLLPRHVAWRYFCQVCKVLLPLACLVFGLWYWHGSEFTLLKKPPPKRSWMTRFFSFISETLRRLI